MVRIKLSDAGSLVVALVMPAHHELRTEAREVIARLPGPATRPRCSLGDNTITANALGKEAGITEVHAGLRSEDEADIIRRLKARWPTAMVGEGVNDAPARHRTDK